MPVSSFPVEHLFTVTALTNPPALLANAPTGTRVIVGVTGGSFEGPKLRGEVVGGLGGDWAAMQPSGGIRLDVRLLLHTDDGADIVMTYQGRGAQAADGLKLVTAPVFETGDERYAWINDVQGIATGGLVEGGVQYEVYTLA